MRRLILALASGILQFLAFPPVGWWWTAPLGVAALLLAVRGAPGSRAAGLGLIAGWAFFLPLLHWLTVLGWDAWLALALVIAGWYAGMGWALSVVADLRWWPLAVPVVWVLQEWLRSRFPWGGLGWGRLAFGQPDSPFTGWVTVGGAPLLTAAVALAGCLLVLAMTSWRAAAGAVVGLLGIGLVGGLVWPVTSPEAPPAASRLAVVQGNVPQPGIDFLGRPLAVLSNHQRTTIELAAAVRLGDEPQPDAVIWPENSADIDPVERPEARELVDSAAVAIDAPILVGTVRSVGPDRAANVGVVWDPVAGPTDAYVKQHPVPFGEFLPMRPLLSRFITRFDRVPRDFIAGEEPGVLRLGPAVISDVICFEISNDEIVRTGVREGGRAVVVQTNNATYATTAQPEQQFDISRLRARETGRDVLVAATTGVTAVITPMGEWIALPQLESGWINREVSLRDTWTPAVRFGGLVDGILSALGAVVIGLGLWGRRRRHAVER
ncbi:MAG TPA: apolipoprotein N-acyltransferase [Actinomycetota bacterium]|nr:apolipoprotein N-acyltransferase [Actinomycetota bacterium]